MFPALFQALDDSAAVRILFGPNPLRVYLPGEAPQGVQEPYVVWQTVGGEPENHLGDPPVMDRFTTQIDVYSSGKGSKPITALRTAAKAVRDAIEAHPDAYITAYNGESRERETNLFRYSFDVDWLTSRNP